MAQSSCAETGRKPRSLKEARERIDALVLRKQEIEISLGCKNLLDRQGNRLRGPVYWKMRDRLLKERFELEQDVRNLKKYITGARLEDKIGLSGIGPEDTEKLLRGALELIRSFAPDSDTFDPEEEAFLDVLTARVHGTY
jgi:hypothetical protein